MKKKMVIFLLAGTLGLSSAGSNSFEKTHRQGEANEAAEDQAVSFEDMGSGETEIQTADLEEEALYETEEALDPINPAEYLIKDAADYVTLGDYMGIPLEKTVYEITDDMVQERIAEDLEMYAEEVKEDRPAQEEDTVYGDLSYVIEGTEEPYEEEDFFLTVGYEEYGKEFDEKIIGASRGDTLEFSISYPEDSEMMDWAGNTVNFVFKVIGVYSMDVPEYTEEFVKDTLGFKSAEEYETYVRETLAEEYEESSYADAIDTLFDEAVARTEFKEYPQELYDACRKEIVGFYTSFGGTDSEEEIYGMFGITEEDINEEVLATVNRRLLVSAYCLANDIEVTEDEYVSYLEENAALYGEPSAASFESIYGRDSLVWTMYESRFTGKLYEQADITEVSYDPSMDEEEETEL